jgi:hypothetical protein
MHQAITAVWRRLRHLFDMSVVNMDSKRERERGGEEKRMRRLKSAFIPSGANRW